MKLHLILSVSLFFALDIQAQTYDEHIRLAQKAIDEDDLGLAVYEYTNALKFDTHKAWVYLRRSMCFADQNRYNEAYADVDTALMISPGNPICLAFRGEYLYALDKHEDALKDLDIAIARDTTLPRAYYTRSQIYMDNMAYDKGLKDIRKAVELEPTKGLYLTRKGELFQLTGERDSAVKTLCSAFLVAKEDNYLASYHLAIKILELDEKDSALSWMNWTIKKFGRMMGNISFRGETYFEMGRYKEAIADFDEVIAMRKPASDPRLAHIYDKRGLCYDSLGNKEQAMLDFNEAISWDTTYSESYVYRGSLYMRAGNTDAALKDFNKAISQNRSIGIAYYFRALLYLQNYNEPEVACGDLMSARQYYYKPAVALLRQYCGK